MSNALMEPPSGNDLYHAIRRGWFPETSLETLEELRLRHEALITVREQKHAERTAVHERFDAEDAARKEGLEAAYREGREPNPPDLTPEDERRALLREADAHASAASQAVVAFVREAISTLRGDDVSADWNPYIEVQANHVPPGGEAARLLDQIADEEALLRQRIADAQRTIAQAERELRSFIPLKTWIVRNGNAGPGQIMPGAELVAPEAYTPMTKPRDLDVPGWAPPDDGVTDEELITDDVEEGVVEMSDPWFLEMERRALQEGREL